MISDSDLTLAFEILVDGMGPTISGRGIAATAARVHRGFASWRRDSSVVGIGIGLRRSGDADGGERCIKVFVRHKRPRHVLAHPVPHRMHLPGISIPVPIDVEALPSGLLHGGSPAAGSSVRNATRDGPGGSFGCLLRSPFDQRLYLLGCAHVLANGVSGPAVGDRIAIGANGGANGGADGGPNSSADGNEIADAARLTAWVAPVPSLFGYPNRVDAAIAEVVSPPAVQHLLDIQPRGLSGDIRSGMTVQVNGARSGRQRSMVVCERAVLEFEAEVSGMGIRRFALRDQVFCRDGTAPGDSGACVVNENGLAVGLHLWGADGKADDGRGEISVFTPMTAVLNAFAPTRTLEIASDLNARSVSRERPPIDDLDDAIDIAARTIFGEARREPPEGRLAVAEVIYNRAMRRSERFGTSIEQVCRKPFQFSCWNPDDPNRARILSISLNDPEIADSLVVARDVVAGRVGALTLGAEHYHHHRVSPLLTSGRTPSARIGSNVYFNDVP